MGGAANEPKETELVLGVYVDGKLKKGRTAGEISSKLDSIEAKLMESKVGPFFSPTFMP